LNSSKEVHPKGFSGLASLSSYLRQDSQPGAMRIPNVEKKLKTPRQILLNVLWTIGINGCMVMLAAWTFNWLNAWLYVLIVGINAGQTAYETLLLNREKIEVAGSDSSTPIPGFILFLLVLIQMTIPLIAGFDHRWQWAPLHLGWILWITFGILILTPLFTIVIRIPQNNRRLVFLLSSANTISIPLLLESGVASILATLVIVFKWRYLLNKAEQQ